MENDLEVKSVNSQGSVYVAVNQQPRSQASLQVKHVVSMWWTEALTKAGCHMTKFSNIFGKFIKEIKYPRSCKANFPTIWKNLVM